MQVTKITYNKKLCIFLSVLFAMLAFAGKGWGQSVYTEDFGTATITTQPYSYGTNPTGSASLNANLNSVTPSWSQTIDGVAAAPIGTGNPTGCMGVTVGTHTYVITCTFAVNSGYQLNPTSIGFDNRGTGTAPTSLTINISGTGGSTSVSVTPSTSSTFTTTSATSFSNTSLNLTGTITLTFTFTGGTNAAATEKIR